MSAPGLVIAAIAGGLTLAAVAGSQTPPAPTAPAPAGPAGQSAAQSVGQSAAQSAGQSALRPLPRPRDFVDTVDNPYLPLPPGTRWVYAGRGAERGQRTVVRVLARRRTIEGIAATVVRDTVSEDGERVEDTFDWFAQDRTGAVWYLGERTREYRDGEVVSTAGSWEAGVDGAQAGIVMPAVAVLGDRYWQEFSPGEAEDQAEVIETATRVTVPAADFDRVRVTHETTPLEPDAAELKFYAPGVGLVLELGLSPDAGRTVLVETTRG